MPFVSAQPAELSAAADNMQIIGSSLAAPNVDCGRSDHGFATRGCGSRSPR